MVGEHQQVTPPGARTPELRPPGSLPNPASPTPAGRLVVWLALLLLLAVAVGVVILLPRLSANLPTDTSATPMPAQQPTARQPASEPPVPAARDRAEKRLREYLRLRAELELENAPLWGEPDWSEAGDEIRQGDRLFLQNAFADADDAYRRATERITAMAAGRSQRLAAALDQAGQALADDLTAAAIKHFEFALAIEPENMAAVAGLASASVREQVLALMAAGQQAEARGELEEAGDAFQQAAALDAGYAQAGEAVHRVNAQIEQAAFRMAMSEAIQAIEAHRYEAAENALRTAAALRPGDVSVRDQQARLSSARTQARLAQLRRRAESKVTAEDWQAALDIYEQALSVDPAAAFAVAGKGQASARLQLHRQLDHYLRKPERLSADEPLANAQRVLLAAGDAPASEPGLAGKLASLRQAVTRAQTPVRVTLESDGMTEVVIYHVGNQGRFQQQDVELRPGTYTVVGSRIGYRDVRRQFVVTPGVTPPVVTIRCEETI